MKGKLDKKGINNEMNDYNNGKKIAIFGVGNFGKKLLKILNKKSIKVDFFIDQYSQQTYLEGIPVYRLKDAPKDAVIYVSVIDRIPYEVPASIMKILGDRYCFFAETLSKYGFIKVVEFTEVLKQFPELFEVFFKDKHFWFWWRRNKNEMLNYEKLDELEKLLTNEQSKKTLNQIVKFRENLTYQFYPFPVQEVQYFPADIIPRNWERINFVDVGSFIGDTLPWLFHFYGNKIKSIVCFEPEKKNLITLNSTINDLKKSYPETEFIVVPVAIWNSDGFMGFDSMAATSKVSENTENLVPLITLEKALTGYTPTYIKMDIEGAEIEAIKGAEGLIKRTKPYLAISIYHRPADLWEIPLLINDKFPFYDFHIRVHGNLGLETVLYCIPKN